ncbi:MULTISPECIES: xanthine dehydrogenase accessory protein XdhC [Pseudomonas]|uniref:xanthine dehydrogenase accessory protein XdhC n=1 Tax=Pseudomonas TaxID=286 RepID=UPI001C501137|nr:xanthine dehydrogenase accessory protein XdhC [Pseudomonas sp. D1HM]MBW0235673.1 molybdenum cofactor sulfurylase [Pseudomonas sp. D1HM]
MNDWISALADLQRQGEPCVLVTIIEEQGSTPRNAGSKMVISATQNFDTIGGGHLEYKALQIARDMLANGKHDTHLQRFILGASLGQCCGGVAVLLFEPIGQVHAQIAVFGAGHVARALVPLLASLPCRVRWIDSREQEFPASVPEGVRKIVTDEPVFEVSDLPSGCYCIVMTHNHALDLEICTALLKRNDFTYFGLIGSKTKRMKFEHRLRERGISASQVQRMRCPMGLSEVKGKLPIEIAISIAGEIIATYNTHFGQHTACAESAAVEPIKKWLPSPRRSHATN